MIRASLRAVLVLHASLFVPACIPFAQRDPAVRVLVFNIHAGKDARGQGNLAGVAQLIRSTDPDVVLLQEVDRGTKRSGGVDQLKVVADRTDYTPVFGRSLDYDGGEYGIAALTRQDVYFTNTVPLPVAPTQTRAGGSREPRVGLLVVTRTALGSLQLVNTHLDASRDDIYRLQETAALLNIVRSRLSPETPVLLGGDLNSEPESEVQHRLRTAGLRDAWMECGQGDGFTFPAHQPVRRIDYLMLTGSLTCTSARVIETTISDHRPLLVSVVRRANARGD
ncbi:MAG TPA: endonuclease/exonuclease/phosphatase family protein [Vicinamibacterales bacterium]|nr:endonuclease/exonuclease/phosphatase family protein [Vicinamibacterales bacterium]